jgi:hypothetical protein
VTAHAREEQAIEEKLGEVEKPTATRMEGRAPVRVMRRGPKVTITGMRRFSGMCTRKTDASATGPRVGPKTTCPPSS